MLKLNITMNLPVSGIVIIMVIFVGGIIAVSAFLWAVRNKQFRDLNSGAYVIFDDDEPTGHMTDTTFTASEKKDNSNGGGHG